MESEIVDEWNVAWSDVQLLGEKVPVRTISEEERNINESHRSSLTSERSGKEGTGRTVRTILHTLAGTYKGKIVAIKMIQRDTVELDQSVIYKEIKQIYYLNHENLNTFVGVCPEAPNVCVLMLYADRGSLQDVLADEKYNVNWEFRVCIAYDIAQGMEYMHGSPIGPHGHLTSSNCVIDRKWTCKITDYGLKQFKRPKTVETSSFKLYLGLLWTAPEILLSPENDKVRVNGTKEGDVYSFGIIVSELMTRQFPFESDLSTGHPEDVIRKIISMPSYHPSLPAGDEALSADWNSLANLCWYAKPEVRPSFKEIRLKLKSFHGGNIPNLIERVQMMLTSDLDETHKKITEERRKTVVLQQNMIPRATVDQVRKSVGRESINMEPVTLALCDITGCYTTRKNILPKDMVTFFNGLHALYDRIFEKYDISQISIRGCKDSMMLATGHLSSNEKHAEDMCDAALEIVAELLQFKPPEIPNAIFNAYISIHSGVVMASMIGRLLSRQIMFGDVVETVKYIHVNSKAMRIQLSDATYGHIKGSGEFSVQPAEPVKLEDSKKIRCYWLSGKIERLK